MHTSNTHVQTPIESATRFGESRIVSLAEASQRTSS